MTENAWARTEQLVADILVLAKQLHQQLAQEADILKSALQPGDLDRCTAHKTQLLGQLEGLNRQFSEILARAGLPDDQSGINAYFQRAAADGLAAADTVARWREIQQTCTQCRSLNESNGASIDVLSQHAKRSLDILKGKNGGAIAYGRDGAPKNDPLTHTLTFYS